MAELGGVNPYQAPNVAVDRQVDETYQPSLFSLRGRIGRIRYLAFQTANYFLVVVPFGVLSGLATSSFGPFLGGLVAVLGWSALVIMSLIVTRRRCHDMGWSGWAALMVFVPLINLLFVFKAGDTGPNQYGPPAEKHSKGTVFVALVFPLIALLGIVAAIAIPAYQNYAKQARHAQYQQPGQ
ncbi:uncharacterized membrane protein YhaH (DUF805 family) [Chitinivorax tropicus]|uniref:Uncharacterized membrane protein YhaH (DUF805 family) n=1 Tax=Chitinivorax tropicus TaxID=714531 RepID=A0A840MTK2_9PROT|nr:DUF805 domain-containing protein [Chitinivorax tropicus]MBB5018531.1 uncharacterized membrane protein YhaH (DUF805 family) [Chitinivorax tropicus]